MSQEGAGTREPATSLGLLDATMVGIGAMIGAGIFVLTGLAVDIAGPGAILVFALNGGVTTFTAMSYAELASAIPRNGGGYAYVREAFSAPVSFVMGWTRWFTYIAAGGLYALGFSSNLVEFAEIYVHLPRLHVGYAVVAVLALVALNALSTSASGGTETVVTLLKVLVLLVFVAFGASVVDLGRFRPLFPGDRSALAVLPAMGLTFIAFQGYDLIATVTEEVENPRRNIPRAILLSVAATVVIYLAVVGVAIGTLGWQPIARAGETAVAEAAKGFMPVLPIVGTGGALIALGAVLSTVSALNAVVIGSSRVAFAMSREGQLPSRLGRIHARFGTPFLALLATGAIMLVAVFTVPIRTVGYLASLFSLAGFVVVNLAVIRLRRRRPDMERPWKIPLYPLPPVLGIVLNVLLAIYVVAQYPESLVIGVGWLVVGAVAYRLYSSRSGGERGGGAA